MIHLKLSDEVVTQHGKKNQTKIKVLFSNLIAIQFKIINSTLQGFQNNMLALEGHDGISILNDTSH